jgi:ApbE superfamily uncharacterized protein (UPF0280 family)
MVWEPRTYRAAVDAAGLVTFEVVCAETDLQISAACDLSAQAGVLVRELRHELEAYIAKYPRFGESYVPVDVDPGAPEMVRAMADAADAAGVGPMAAVAGAIAERVARGLEPASSEVIVENGGDVFIISRQSRVVTVGAQGSPLSEQIAIRVERGRMPAAVCTSSGKVGHSVSHGAAHAVTIVADDGALADAVATAVGNVVHGPDDIDAGLAKARSVPGVRGALVVVGDRAGVVGDVQLVRVRR